MSIKQSPILLVSSKTRKRRQVHCMLLLPVVGLLKEMMDGYRWRRIPSGVLTLLVLISMTGTNPRSTALVTMAAASSAAAENVHSREETFVTNHTLLLLPQPSLQSNNDVYDNHAHSDLVNDGRRASLLNGDDRRDSATDDEMLMSPTNKEGAQQQQQHGMDMNMQQPPLPNFFSTGRGDTNIKRQSHNYENEYDHRRLATVVEFSEDWSSGTWSPAWTHRWDFYNAFGTYPDVLYTPEMSAGQLRLEAYGSCWLDPPDGMDMGVIRTVTLPAGLYNVYADVTQQANYYVACLSSVEIKSRIDVNGLTVAARSVYKYGPSCGVSAWDSTPLVKLNLNIPGGSTTIGLSTSTTECGGAIALWDNIIFERILPTPSPAPTRAPTRTPTRAPTKAPTRVPTKAPTKVPTLVPTKAPTKTPTRAPTKAPTKMPTKAPTKAPTRAPTKVPTPAPKSPTKVPTLVPVKAPTRVPTKAPAKTPTRAPTRAPVRPPSSVLTRAPTRTQTTNVPTPAPIKAPAKAPTRAPTKAPTRPLTKAPTRAPIIKSPTRAPTKAPSLVAAPPIGIPTTTTPNLPAVGPAPTSSPLTRPLSRTAAPNPSPLSEAVIFLFPAPTPSPVQFLSVLAVPTTAPPPPIPTATAFGLENPTAGTTGATEKSAENPSISTTTITRKPSVALKPPTRAPSYQEKGFPTQQPVATDKTTLSSSASTRPPSLEQSGKNNNIVTTKGQEKEEQDNNNENNNNNDGALLGIGGDESRLDDEVTVKDITLTLTFESQMVRKFNHYDILEFERIVAEVCMEYYDSLDDDGADNDENDQNSNNKVNSDMNGQRRLTEVDQRQRRRDARDVIMTEVKFVRQDLFETKLGTPVNVITYDQRFVFEPSNATAASGGNAADYLYPPPNLSKLPFNDTYWNMKLGEALRKKVDAMDGVILPLEMPFVPDQTQSAQSEQQDKEPSRRGLSAGGSWGVFLACAAIFTAAGVYALKVIDEPISPPAARRPGVKVANPVPADTAPPDNGPMQPCVMDPPSSGSYTVNVSGELPSSTGFCTVNGGQPPASSGSHNMVNGSGELPPSS